MCAHHKRERDSTEPQWTIKVHEFNLITGDDYGQHEFVGGAGVAFYKGLGA